MVASTTVASPVVTQSPASSAFPNAVANFSSALRRQAASTGRYFAAAAE